MTFAMWLQKQVDRNDAIGHLAKLVEDNRPKGTGTSTFESQLRCYQRGYGLTDAQSHDLRLAYAEYKTACHDLGTMYELWEGESQMETAAPTTRFCPQCGAVNPKTEDRCIKCNYCLICDH